MTSSGQKSAEIINFRLPASNRSIVKMAIVHDVNAEEHSFLIETENASKADVIFTLQLLLEEVRNGEEEEDG